MNNKYIGIILTGVSCFLVGGALVSFTNDLIEKKITKKNLKKPNEYKLIDFVNYGSYTGLGLYGIKLLLTKN